MPTTTTRRQASQLRSDLADLVALAGGDIAAAMRQFDTADTARDGLIDVLRQLLPLYGSAAATLAADWYDELRDADGIGGSFRAIPADLGDLGAEALAGWGIAPLFGAEPRWDDALTLIQGGAQRRIVNAARDTITVSSVHDPKARGWRRVGVGKCDFCRMLIDRGAVYTEATADFLTHDHCGCAAVPEWQ